MKPENYKYNFKYRIEQSKTGWCIKRKGWLGIWSTIVDNIETESLAYFRVEVIETPVK